MMKIFPTTKIKELDTYTIENESIASIDLMERASQAITKAISGRWGTETPFTVFVKRHSEPTDKWRDSSGQTGITSTGKNQFGSVGKVPPLHLSIRDWSSFRGMGTYLLFFSSFV